MERHLLIPAFPKTELNAVNSLAINLFTNIQLVDYYLNGSSKQNDWIRNFSADLSETSKKDLKLLRTVFAHSVILRDFYIKKNSDLTGNWDLFIQWWEQLDEADILALVIYGIRETMDYYHKYIPRMLAVEEVMQEVRLEEESLFQDSDMRRQAVKAVLLSWSVPIEKINKLAEHYDNLSFIKESIIRLLRTFWNSGVNQQWQSNQRALVTWVRQHETLLKKSYPTNGAAIFEITGLYPDTSELEKINRAEYLTFIPSSNLERLLTFTRFDKHIYLMFDPKVEAGRNKEKLSGYSSAFEGLGDITRLQIIDLLAENKEMFAQQIIQQLNLKQSTVSRHLNQLQQANLVTVHQEGNTKYFSINEDELKKVAATLNSFLKV
ncbi:metalloregulator ArsR/SmtB family transcription factor [Oceanobacillus sp. FSL K6-3682]|uniref:ArsR/SmtB family transcription factor n=1 Tax=Oceanobacillus sp. FSL K6-3682 TaxID=2921503 RepID=UPI0030DC3663